MDESTPKPENTNEENAPQSTPPTENDTPPVVPSAVVAGQVAVPSQVPEIPPASPPPPTGNNEWVDGMVLPHEKPKNAKGFLLVLCILTFVGSGFGLLSTGWTIINGPDGQIRAAQELESQIRVMPRSSRAWIEESLDFTYAYADNFWMYTLVTLLLISGCLAGGIMMYRLKKTGFFIYTISTVVAIFLPLVLVVNSISLMALGITAFFGALFVIMYAVNLKQME